MKVLSLFDGISCGMLALQRANIPVEKYYASEIDKNAIKISQHNFPEISQIGDVNKLVFENYKDVDLLIGGSPCQSFSSAGKMLNFKDSRGQLFFKFVEALKIINPKYFLLENVVMKQEWQDIISKYLCVAPIEINSSLVSAQNRRRLYWTNIYGVTQPEDKGIKLEDILDDIELQKHGAIRGYKLNKATIVGRRLNENENREDYNKKILLVQCLEVRKNNVHKSNCLTTVDKDNVLTPLPPGRYPNAFDGLPFRYYTIKEMCRLQTLPDDYVDSVSKTAGRKAIGNSWTVDVIAHILSFIKEY